MKVSELIAVLKQLPQDDMINVLHKDDVNRYTYSIYEPVVKPLTENCDGDQIGWIIVPVRTDA